MTDNKTTPKTVRLRYIGAVAGTYWDGGWKKVACGDIIEVPEADKTKWLKASTWELKVDKPKAKPKTKTDDKESE